MTTNESIGCSIAGIAASIIGLLLLLYPLDINTIMFTALFEGAAAGIIIYAWRRTRGRGEYFLLPAAVSVGFVILYIAAVAIGHHLHAMNANR